MKTQFTKTALLLLAILFSACGDDDGPGQSGNAETYLRMELNGNLELDLTGTGDFNTNPLIAYLTTEANVGLEPNTVQISGGAVNEPGTGNTKVLSIVLMNVTAPGNYDLVEQDGLFVYSVGDSGGGPIAGYTIGDTSDGTCTLTVSEIGENVQPGFGKPIKGTFSATVIIDDAGNTATLTGEFNGGV